MMQYILIVFFLICSAFFSSTEIAFASVNKTRLKRSAEEGNRRAQWAMVTFTSNSSPMLLPTI